MNGQSPSTYLFTQGVLGIVVVVLALTFRWYFNYSQKKIDDLNKIIFQGQADRLTDSKENTKEATAIIQENSQNLRILSEKIEVGKSIGRDNR